MSTFPYIRNPPQAKVLSSALLASHIVFDQCHPSLDAYEWHYVKTICD
jgi:hypothetical protein